MTTDPRSKRAGVTAAPALLDDLIEPDLDILFCGTALSTMSHQRRAYYAGPGNAFWATLHTVGLTPRRLLPEEYRLLLHFHMGLTDLVKDASGADTDLAFRSHNRTHVQQIVTQYQPRILAFTSKRAAQEFLDRRSVELGLQEEMIGRTRLFVLPSPSGRARRTWTIEPWRELAKLRGTSRRS